MSVSVQIRRVEGLALIALGATLAAVPSLHAQGTAAPCDSALARLARGGKIGYGPRDKTRCEGIYTQQVSAPRLVVVSLTRSFQAFNPDSAAKLTVRWDAPVDSGMRLRVRSVKPELYYAMDALGVPGKRSFDWPTGILASERIRRQHLGAVGVARMPVGGIARNVYVPLRIAAGADTATRIRYQLTVYPSLRLKEVFVAVTAVDSAGRPTRLVKPSAPLRYGAYPARQAVTILVDNPGAAGLYQVEVSAVGIDDTPISIEPILFFHAGK